MRLTLLALAALTAFMSAWTCTTASAAGTKADYERAAGLHERTQGKVRNARTEVRFTADSGRVWFRSELGHGKSQFLTVSTESGQKSPAFNHVQLAARLTEQLGREIDPQQLPFDRTALEGSTVRFNIGGDGWTFATTQGALDRGEPLAREESRRGRRGQRWQAEREPRDRVPGGRFAALVRDHNVWLRDLQSGTETQLTRDGEANDRYDGAFHWSPNGEFLVAMKTKAVGDRRVHLIESSPSDQVQPKLHSFDYQKPGDQVPITRPHLFKVVDLREIPLSTELCPNPWSISEVRWLPDSSRFYFLYNERGHQLVRVLAVDAVDGRISSIIEERSATFVDYAHKIDFRLLPATSEIIWMSERDGWNHLYLFDAATGQLKNQITRGNWVVRGIERIDEEARQMWFRAGGISAGQDPYHIHYCRIDFDGANLVDLTPSDGTHEIEFSPDRRYYVDTYSRVDLPPIVELRRSADASLICDLERADWSELLASGWKPPERFVAKGRDGETDIFGVIYRPTNLDVNGKYPIIEDIYAGPHGSFVPKQFAPYYDNQALSELGFIVVQIDGMGTSNRSKKFHDVCWKDLGDSGFPDRIAWIKAAAVKYPYMDTERVGIFGGSAGGQSSTRAVLAHGDFYKAAVSDCGCHDNRMDKIWWNELWMGYPVGPHYAEQSNVTNAHRLTGKLMLVVGELDRNVDPASTMQVANALIKADKDFELLVIPGAGHGAGGSPYGKRRRNDFFVRHLFGVEPRTE